MVKMIEVDLNDDGSLTYRVRPTILSTVHYGLVLARVARDVADMMHAESGGKLDRHILVEQIMDNMLRSHRELVETQANKMGMLQ